jgi:hypothetical protein
MRSVLIVADDLHFTPGINTAIFNLLNLGILSTASAMMARKNLALPKPQEVLDWRHRIGLHLQLSAGTPRTAMHLDGKQIKNFPSKEEASALDPSEVDAEWQSQLEAFRAFYNTLPVRIDSHHGFHRLPKFSTSAERIAAHCDAPLRGDRTQPGSGVIGPEWTGQNKSAEDLIELLKTMDAGLDKDVTIEVVTHPGLDMHELNGIDSWTDVRVNDYEQLQRLHTLWDKELPNFQLIHP